MLQVGNLSFAVFYAGFILLFPVSDLLIALSNTFLRLSLSLFRALSHLVCALSQIFIVYLINFFYKIVSQLKLSV